MNLHHVGDGFPGGQHDVHAVMALSTAVADVGCVILGRLAAGLINAVNRLLHHLVQVGAAGVGVAVHTFNHDLGLEDIRIVPAAAHFQSIELRPQHPVIMAFLHHRNFLRTWDSLKKCKAAHRLPVQQAAGHFFAYRG